MFARDALISLPLFHSHTISQKDREMAKHKINSSLH